MDAFAQGARRAREAGLDGVEVAGGNGVPVTQFLSSAINDRDDEYGGLAREPGALRAADRARDQAPRSAATSTSVQDQRGRVHERRSFRGFGAETRSTTPSRSASGSRRRGSTAFHITAGRGVPAPAQPPRRVAGRGTSSTRTTRMVSSGRHTFRNYVAFRTWPLQAACSAGSGSARFGGAERRGSTCPSRGPSRRRSRPGPLRGGFQTASVVANAITSGACDGVTIARPLLANPNLVEALGRGTRPAAETLHLREQVPRQLRSRTRSAATTRAASTRASRCSRSSFPSRSTASPRMPA